MRRPRLFIQRFSHRIRSAVRSVAGYPVKHNVTAAPTEKPCALVDYLVEPFLLEAGDPRFLEHQNMRQCRQIVAALAGAGYAVDVADVRDRRFRPDRPYELVLSHRVDLATGGAVPPSSLRVYLAAGMNHAEYNRNMRRRYEALAARRECRLEFRTPHTEDVPFVRSVDAIAGFGNERTSGTWCTIAPVPFFPFNNYGYAATRDTTGAKSFEVARQNFLFFASRGQVGKGLDLLLERFARHPELHLYVCSAFGQEREFVRCYDRELFRTPNIHAVGLVGVNGTAFDELTTTCAHVILPSCSEGQPGSVVQCMHAGLIPLVSRECGMDLRGTGLTFDDDDPATIERAVLEIAARPASWHRGEAGRVLQIARTHYSEEEFIRRWDTIAQTLRKMQQEKKAR